MKNDIRELGQIFSHLLSESPQEISQSRIHLIRAMKESVLPSAASILKHPFLWSLEMTTAFLLAARDYYVHHPNFDKISTLNPDQENLITNRVALQTFSLQMVNLFYQFYFYKAILFILCAITKPTFGYCYLYSAI